MIDFQSMFHCFMFCIDVISYDIKLLSHVEISFKCDLWNITKADSCQNQLVIDVILRMHELIEREYLKKKAHIDHQCNEKHWHKQIFQSPFPKRRGALLLLTLLWLLDFVYNMWTLNLPPVATLLGDSNAKFRGNHLTKSLEEREIKLKQHLRGYAFVWQYFMYNNMSPANHYLVIIVLYMNVHMNT